MNGTFLNIENKNPFSVVTTLTQTIRTVYTTVCVYVCINHSFFPIIRSQCSQVSAGDVKVDVQRDEAASLLLFAVDKKRPLKCLFYWCLF